MGVLGRNRKTEESNKNYTSTSFNIHQNAHQATTNGHQRAADERKLHLNHLVRNFTPLIKILRGFSTFDFLKFCLFQKWNLRAEHEMSYNRTALRVLLKMVLATSSDFECSMGVFSSSFKRWGWVPFKSASLQIPRSPIFAAMWRIVLWCPSTEKISAFLLSKYFTMLCCYQWSLVVFFIIKISVVLKLETFRWQVISVVSR